MPNYINPFSKKLDTSGMQSKLAAYTQMRAEFNDTSIPAFTALINEIIKSLGQLQDQLNTHTGQQVPPAHTFNNQQP